MKIIHLVAILALFFAPQALAKTQVHYANQGGHYAGGHGSSHKGGHYRNPRTGNHYTHHK